MYITRILPYFQFWFSYELRPSRIHVVKCYCVFDISFETFRPTKLNSCMKERSQQCCLSTVLTRFRPNLDITATKTFWKCHSLPIMTLGHDMMIVRHGNNMTRYRDSTTRNDDRSSDTTRRNRNMTIKRKGDNAIWSPVTTTWRYKKIWPYWQISI